MARAIPAGQGYLRGEHPAARTPVPGAFTRNSHAIRAAL
jgi:hypothetical protein